MGRPSAIERGSAHNVRLMVGENIRWARKNAGMSQRALATATEIGQNHVSEMENGLRSIGLDMLCRIAEVCLLAPMDLLDPNLQKRPVKRRQRKSTDEES